MEKRKSVLTDAAICATPSFLVYLPFLSLRLRIKCIHLSIPVHKGKTLGIGLLKKLIAKAGLTNEEYVTLFYGKKKR